MMPQLPLVEPPNPSDWPWNFDKPSRAFDLEATSEGLALRCVGCVEPLVPFTFGPSGRTSVHMGLVEAFMREHIASVHPMWTVGS